MHPPLLSPLTSFSSFFLSINYNEFFIHCENRAIIINWFAAFYTRAVYKIILLKCKII